MDLFRRFIERFFTRFPFVRFVVIVVVALLVFFAIKSNVFAINLDTTTYNNVTYTRYIPDNAWGVFQQLPEYISGTYDYLLWCSGGQCYIYFWSNTDIQHFYNNIALNSNNYNGFSHTNDNISCHYYKISENGTTIPTTYETRTSSQMGVNCYSNNGTKTAYFYTNLPVYTDNTLTDVFWQGLAPTFIDPYISDTLHIADLEFDYLMIEGGSETYSYTIDDRQIARNFDLEFKYQGVIYTMNINKYAVVGSDSISVGFAIPKNELFPQLILYNGETMQFDLYVHPSTSPNSDGNWSIYGLGIYTINATSDTISRVNNNRQQALQGNISSSVSQTTNYLGDLTSTDVDSSLIENFFLDNGGGTITDSTGVESFFMILYNAFCTNETINVTFTLPFVNKSVTISSAEISSHYPQALKSLVSTIAWGGIALFICKDIRKMTDKMQEGNIENVSRNVEREVL